MTEQLETWEQWQAIEQKAVHLFDAIATRHGPDAGLVPVLQKINAIRTHAHGDEHASPARTPGESEQDLERYADRFGIAADEYDAAIDPGLDLMTRAQFADRQSLYVSADAIQHAALAEAAMAPQNDQAFETAIALNRILGATSDTINRIDIVPESEFPYNSDYTTRIAQEAMRDTITEAAYFLLPEQAYAQEAQLPDDLIDLAEDVANDNRWTSPPCVVIAMDGIVAGLMAEQSAGQDMER